MPLFAFDFALEMRPLPFGPYWLPLTPSRMFL